MEKEELSRYLIAVLHVSQTLGLARGKIVEMLKVTSIAESVHTPSGRDKGS